MKLLGSFLNKKLKKNTIDIKIDDLSIGFNSRKNHIIKVDENRKVEYVIDKKCDHAGGRLILRGDEAVCPLHGWKLNLNNLTYNDSPDKKTKTKFVLKDNVTIQIDDHEATLVNPFLKNNIEGKLKFIWINHACVYIEFNGTSIITDPWLFGPAFLTGWWLSEPSSEQSIDLLNKADYIYISHNHPDHCHSETLNLVEKNKKIIVANFQTKSTEVFLESLGFTNIIVADFKKIFELEGGLQFSVLKSGDFRDDSGIYLNGSGNQMLLTVDSNFLNSNILPKNIDVLMSAFAGGASGFPLCYNNYEKDEKIVILERFKLAAQSLVFGYVNSSNPKYYHPYAGHFKEKAKRDLFIKETNIKNSIDDVSEIISRRNTEFIKPDKNIQYTLVNNNLLRKKLNLDFQQEDDINIYLDSYKREFIYDEFKIIDYLSNSKFLSNQILYIIPTNDLFIEDEKEKIIFADFKNQLFKTVNKNEIQKKQDGYRVMILNIRKEIISCIIDNMLPWEDFSIGFQARIERFPNEYESEFWFHFTNVYVNKKHIRYSPFCGSCSLIKQNPIFNKYFKN